MHERRNIRFCLGLTAVACTGCRLTCTQVAGHGVQHERNVQLTLAYLVVTGTTTAPVAIELVQGLMRLVPRVITLTTPNAGRVIAPRDLSAIAGNQLVESYFDAAILPRPPDGLVIVAPCSFNSLNKLAHGIADNLALSVAAEAIGRKTPVIVGPSLNQPLLDHPEAQASMRKLPGWGVRIVPPVDEGDGPRLAPTDTLLDAVRPYVRRG
jgi:phosphopantothenoylcysteine synthetase/decarboxylase